MMTKQKAYRKIDDEYFGKHGRNGEVRRSVKQFDDGREFCNTLRQYRSKSNKLGGNN